MITGKVMSVEEIRDTHYVSNVLGHTDAIQGRRHVRMMVELIDFDEPDLANLRKQKVTIAPCYFDKATVSPESPSSGKAPIEGPLAGSW